MFYREDKPLMYYVRYQLSVIRQLSNQQAGKRSATNHWQNPNNTMESPDAKEPALTPFQKRVYGVVRTIPKGCVRTYGSIAKELQTSARAVGTAMGRNPFGPSDHVPWHRVVRCLAHWFGFRALYLDSTMQCMVFLRTGASVVNFSSLLRITYVTQFFFPIYLEN